MSHTYCGSTYEEVPYDPEFPLGPYPPKPMSKTLTQADLNDRGCGTPNCGHDHSVLYLHSGCHPQTPTWAVYEKASGVLTIRCARCRKVVAQLKIAES
jgi:hypothetical protein